MGLKNWLGKNVAGVSAYGAVTGRESVKNGLALGRVLYLGHGKRPTPTSQVVFKDDKTMNAEGFELYCQEPLNRRAMEDSSTLSKDTRTAGTAFAIQLSVDSIVKLRAQRDKPERLSTLIGSRFKGSLRDTEFGNANGRCDAVFKHFVW
jgi:hypothetical protein